MDNYFSDPNPSHKTDLTKLLLKYPKVTTDRPGKCNIFKHDIKLVSYDVQPIRQRAYRLNPQKREIMKKEVDFLLNHHLAEPSNSPWASPSLLIPKADGSFRFCTDYRKVNQVTVSDSFPLPLIEDVIDQIGNARLITTIDLLKGITK